MWEALFSAVAAGFNFFSSLVNRNQSPVVKPADDFIDGPAARTGTAAGAAANEAAHAAGKKTMSDLSKEDLERHTEILWGLCAKYVAEHGLEDKTTGILIVRELVADDTHQPNVAVMYVGDPRNAAVTLARVAQTELHRANILATQAAKG